MLSAGGVSLYLAKDLQVLDIGCHRCLDTGLHPHTRVWDNGCRVMLWDLHQEGQRRRGEHQQEGRVRYDMYFSYYRLRIEILVNFMEP
jgi:hypothetical protein